MCRHRCRGSSSGVTSGTSSTDGGGVTSGGQAGIGLSQSEINLQSRNRTDVVGFAEFDFDYDPVEKEPMPPHKFIASAIGIVFLFSIFGAGSWLFGIFALVVGLGLLIYAFGDVRK